MKSFLFVSLFALFLANGCAINKKNHDNATPQEAHIQTKWRISRLSTYKQQYTAFTPAKDYDVVYITGKSGTIYKIDPNNGTVLDSFNTNNSLTGGLAISGNSIFVNTVNAKLMAFNKITHKFMWQADLPTIAIETPLIANNFVVVRTNDAQIIVFDIDTGKKIWVYNSNPPNLTLYNNHSLAIINNELLLVGFPDGKLVLFSLNIGNVIWEQSLKTNTMDDITEKLRDITVAPIIKDDKIFIANYMGDVFCVDLIHGSILWNRNIEGPISNLAIDNEDLYVGANNGKKLYALSQDSGKMIWRKSFNVTITNLTSLNYYLLAADMKGYVHVISSADGRVLDDYKIAPGGLINSMVIPTVGVLFQGQNGEVSLVEVN